MNLFSHRFFKRSTLIIANAIKQISSQLINIIVSIIIIKKFDTTFWGEFSSYLIYISFIGIIVSWGNKELLLRTFSEQPSKISKTFYAVFNTRVLLILIATTISFLIYAPKTAFLLLIWITAIHVSQSLEALLNYKRNFLDALMIEFFMFGILILGLYRLEIKEINDLILIYSVYHALRAVLFIILFKQELKSPKLSFEIDYLKRANSFFLLGLAGFLQSRADFIIISFFETDMNVGFYQIINAYFILVHAIGTFLIAPFVKNIFRLSNQAIAELQKRIIIWAPIIVLFSMLLLYVLCTFVYQFEVSWNIYLIGIGIVLPPYFYAVKIFEIYKIKQEKFVLKTAFIAIFISTIISIVLLKLKFGYIGALIAAAVAQLFTAIRYSKFKINDGKYQFK